MVRFCFLLICLFGVGARAWQTYKRVGNPVYPAVITGFYTPIYDTQSNRGNFKVRYVYNDKVIDAYTIESDIIDLERYEGKNVEVYVSEKNPYVVSMKGNHCLDFPCAVLLLIGILGIIYC